MPPKCLSSKRPAAKHLTAQQPKKSKAKPSARTDGSVNTTSPDNAQSLAAAVSATVMRDLQQMVHQQVEAALAAHGLSQTSAPPRTAATTGTAPPPAATSDVNQEAVLESDCVNLEVPINLALFVAFLHGKGYAPSTVETYMSAISFIHKLNRAGDPASDFLVRKAIQGLHKARSTADSQLPISLPVLHKLVDALPRMYQHSLQAGNVPLHVPDGILCIP